ncbi:helix-turn-helix transcriptional regulator [Bifidobacterium longum subsp. longum]|jgi:transcriptional regulator with XRE-family HTH domain|uniref:helix-turn-helix domain-containing protein n=1 Tax=Bifidobacterium longum TaxID=216816 RepID=UPI000C31152C|nr:helix-turn-helix transcriptional regulator [Bifidobacterium longum]MDR3976099.1 helix-turn-helix transcriptional regulator [Bifidobacterium sp.]MBS6716325.1 helix-turn-helix transcriptional regulator [Bifidobacterium longum]MDR5620255.1 helix-turn-helix transcriptional regulator [Bifidobacterium longum]PKC80416.1 Helix-turn-helix domain [Bifidobacterium longum]QOL28044.1 helix-turn-helix transcriptional regulator [Bifidobacterium longum subsp. longum]
MSRLDVTEQRRRKFGDAIRSARKAKSISQEHLAELAELDRAYMGRVERGEQSVSLDKIWAICDALDTTPSQLFTTAE